MDNVEIRRNPCWSLIWCGEKVVIRDKVTSNIRLLGLWPGTWMGCLLFVLREMFSII